MWVFFTLVSVALAAIVGWLLYRFPLKNVPMSVRLVVALAWGTSFSIIAFIPVDVWATLDDRNVHPIYVMWEITYWLTQFLTWLAIPLFMGYVDSGAFSLLGKFRGSIRDNLLFYSILLALSVVGIMFVLAAGNLNITALPGTCIALTNMFGLTVVMFLLGYGLVSFPRSTWRLSNPEAYLKKKHYDMGKLSLKVEEAIAEMERVNLVVHASEEQISRRAPLRSYMDIVCMEFMKSKPSGIELEKGRGLQDQIERLSAQELDYALDLRGLMELRKRVRNAGTRFEGARTEYISTVKQAMTLAEICKRRQNRDYTAQDRDGLSGKLYWYLLCIVSPVMRRVAAVVFAVLSVVVIWSELVIVGERGYLSPIHLLMKSADTEWAVYCVILLPLAYVFFCTYHTLFNLAAFRFYHLIPKASPSYSLLLNGSLMCRFAAPLAYNFLHVIQVIEVEIEDSTAFSKVMGAMDVLPFFGTQFNSLLPIFLLIHCLLIYFDFWKKLGNWFIPVRYQFCEDEADDDHSNKGRLLLFKEQEAKEQGKSIGEILGINPHLHPSNSVNLLISQSSVDAGHTRGSSLDAPLAQIEGGVAGEQSAKGNEPTGFPSQPPPERKKGRRWLSR